MNTIKPIAVPVPEACRIAGFGRTSLYAAISRGEIEARKAGKKTLILVASLENYLANLPRIGE